TWWFQRSPLSERRKCLDGPASAARPETGVRSGVRGAAPAEIQLARLLPHAAHLRPGPSRAVPRAPNFRIGPEFCPAFILPLPDLASAGAQAVWRDRRSSARILLHRPSVGNDCAGE